MKKAIYILSALIIVLILAAVVAISNFPSFASYMLGKIINGEARITQADITYKAGTIILDFGDTWAKGDIGGSAKHWQLTLGIGKGLHLKRASISDFDLTISKTADRAAFFPAPLEFFEIQRGAVTYNNQKFFIDEAKLGSLIPERPFSFEATIRNGDLFKAAYVSGEGTYRGIESDVRGLFSITSLNLGKLSKDMDGITDAKGPFTYSKKRFVFRGPFELLGYTLRDDTFRKPFYVDQATGDVSFVFDYPSMEINISRTYFHKVPLVLNLNFERFDLSRLELGSGFLDIETIKDNIALERIAKAQSDLWTCIIDGQVKINKFVFRRKHPLHADLELKNTSISYRDLHFTDVEGLLSFDDKKATYSNAKGKLKTSMFYNVSGITPFAVGKAMKATGNYAFNLNDIPPSLVRVDDLVFRSGETVGAISLAGNEESGYLINGEGKLRKAEIIWKNQLLAAEGDYKFNNDGIAVNSLIINKAATELAITGKWNSNNMDLKIKGVIDIDHIKPFLTMPFNVAGTAGVDVELDKNNSDVKLDGDISMDDLYWEVPGIIKKNKGISSKASVTVLTGEKETHIDRLSYKLDAIELNLKGIIRADKSMDLDVATDIPDISKIGRLFHFDGGSTRGELALNLSVRDLRLPLKKLPYMDGRIRVNNGSLRLPWVANPFKGIDLISDFKGETFDVKLDRLVYGNSILSNGTLRITGLESPLFSLYMNMEKLDLDDFKTAGTFTIPQIYDNSLMSRVSGDMSLRVKELHVGNFDGEFLDAKGLLSERKLNISEMKMNAFGGNIDVLGFIDLRPPIPHVYVNGGVYRTRSGLLMKAFDAKARIMDGRSSIHGHLDADGRTMEELIGDVSGNVAIYSRDGSILKWNLLSKVFGLLNIYDLLRGKAELEKEGLPYKKMGATFVAKNGILYTKDFLIDSPSMVINGDGSLDIKKNTVDGNIAVSPLVTIDRTIAKIPILRSILREKDKGFLYVAYKVSGPMDDPDINVNFVNSIGGRTLEILRNILILPKELLERGEQKQ